MKSWLMVRFLSLAFALCLAGARRVEARPVTREEIQHGYERAALGAEIKFVDGLLANRADNYVVFAPDGARQDLSVERSRFAQFFQQGTRVLLETKILEYKSKGDHAGVVIDQVLKVEVADEKNQQLYTKMLVTRSIDQWELIGGVPRVTGSRVLQQYFKRGPALPDDHTWKLVRVLPKPVKPSKPK